MEQTVINPVDPPLNVCQQCFTKPVIPFIPLRILSSESSPLCLYHVYTKPQIVRFLQYSFFINRIADRQVTPQYTPANTRNHIPTLSSCSVIAAKSRWIPPSEESDVKRPLIALHAACARLSRFPAKYAHTSSTRPSGARKIFQSQIRKLYSVRSQMPPLRREAPVPIPT